MREGSMTADAGGWPRQYARRLVWVLGLALGLALHGPGSARADHPAADLLAGAVGVSATIPGDTFTAGILGTRRSGSGIVIDAGGLVLTIGYLILEAATVDLTEADGRVVPAEVVAYDFETGFGLVRAALPLASPPVRLGRSADLREGDPVLVLAHAGAGPPQGAEVVSRRTFAGYWEYLLDDAIFTAPPHPGFGGAGLIDAGGTLVGIGSLFVGDAAAGRPLPGNMFVPIDALKPILADLIAFGRSTAPPRPWLGLITRQVGRALVVVRVTPDGPAAAAGLRPGDAIVGVAGARIAGMEDFYRKVRALGDAGVEVPIDTLVHGSGTRRIIVQSSDRYRFLRLNPTY